LLILVTRVSFNVAGLLARIGQQCEDVLERHAAMAPERFYDDEAFRRAVAEVLESRAAALATVRKYLAENRGANMEMVMRDTVVNRQRVYLSFLERTLARCLPRAGRARLRRRVSAGQSERRRRTRRTLCFPLMTPLMLRWGRARVLRCLVGVVAASADVKP
jgi:hypothetical protein